MVSFRYFKKLKESWGVMKKPKKTQKLLNDFSPKIKNHYYMMKTYEMKP
jgi:hypothetical protein